MKYVFVVLLALLCAFSISTAEAEMEQPDLDEYSLLKCIDKSELVVVGTVQLLTYHDRDNVLFDGAGCITTDVTVRIDTVVKGTPNMGSRHVKFMILGGPKFYPDLNEMLTLEVSTEPLYEVGEKVMLFMTKSIEEEDYYKNYHYGRLHTILMKYGKRLIEDDKAVFAYKKTDDTLVKVEMPLDLTVELAKAAVANKTSTVPLEDQIKALARAATTQKVELSKTLVTRLKDSAKTIITNAEDD